MNMCKGGVPVDETCKIQYKEIVIHIIWAQPIGSPIHGLMPVVQCRRFNLSQHYQLFNKHRSHNKQPAQVRTTPSQHSFGFTFRACHLNLYHCFPSPGFVWLSLTVNLLLHNINKIFYNLSPKKKFIFSHFIKDFK